MALLRVRSHQNMVNNKISDHQDWRVIYPHIKYFYENMVRQKQYFLFFYCFKKARLFWRAV